MEGKKKNINNTLVTAKRWPRSPLNRGIKYSILLPIAVIFMKHMVGGIF